MPIVAVELATESPPAAMARALLDACSASAREGTCVLSTQASTEPRIAVATVTWSDSSERNARIEVHLERGDASTARARTIVFKDSDARLERWRSVGLTIATLVGDALAPKTTGGGAQSTVPVGKAAFEHEAATEQSADTGQQTGEAAPAISGTAAPAKELTPPNTPPPGDVAKTPEPPLPGGRHEDKLPHTLWAGLSGTFGPGLDQGAWKVGALVDLGYRPAALPIFARISFEYATRGSDPQGLSVQWQTATIGGGGVLGTGVLRAEPHLAIGVENIHASASDSETGRSESGNQLGVTFHGGLDGVLQLSRFGIIAFLQGKQALAPTQIVVKGELVGRSPSTGWGFGVGARYFFE